MAPARSTSPPSVDQTDMRVITLCPFQQGSALFWLEGVCICLIGAGLDRLRGPVTKPGLIGGPALRALHRLDYFVSVLWIQRGPGPSGVSEMMVVKVESIQSCNRSTHAHRVDLGLGCSQDSRRGPKAYRSQYRTLKYHVFGPLAGSNPTMRIPSGVASPATTNHATKGSVCVNLRGASNLKYWLHKLWSRNTRRQRRKRRMTRMIPVRS